jgi:glutamine cyclotransferase
MRPAAAHRCERRPRPGPTQERVEQLGVRALDVLPHDPKAYAQGLEMAGRTLYEGTGTVGESSIRLSTPGRPPTVRADLPAPLFGEEITVLGPALWKLTWRDHTAIERDAGTLTRAAPSPLRASVLGCAPAGTRAAGHQ